MSEQIRSVECLKRIKDSYLKELDSVEHKILVCGGAGCISSDCASIQAAVCETLEKLNLKGSTRVLQTGCMGICAVGPVMLILPERTFYVNLTPKITREIIEAQLVHGEVLEYHTFFDQSLQRHVPCLDDIDFFRLQVKIALRNCGEMEHESIEAYIARDGYKAIHRCVSGMTCREVVDEVKKSGLRGRGGAGFPAGTKLEVGLKAAGDQKYMCCNADEGDPGAFMDRSLIEGDPHSLIEGMMIGGYAIGANKGFIYVRAEYPLAIERLERAIGQAREYGLLGGKIFFSDFEFDLEIRIGAGAYVCGEETALMNSVQGQRGEPNQKPPFPFQSGLFGKPTIINNVETLVNLPAILLNGADWYAGFGSEKSKGTKVFALAGDIVNTGIVEVPIGVPVGNILYDIGGGVPSKKRLKAAQIGGPSGGCVTTGNLNVPTDYESLSALGAIMGSGGLIAMDEDTCMVDTARYFMEFVQEESCGKCVACRIGTKRMLEILERITAGKGMEGDIELIEELAETIQEASLCGLGQTAPNPVLSALENFREEFEEHITKKYCRASICGALFVSPCENTCPANINVPGYMALVEKGRFMDAYHLIRQENPFPAVCGRVCTRPCEAKCRRGGVDEPVAICDIKRFVSDYARRHEQPYVQDMVFPKNGKRVAIIGAGAAGLTCGYYLARIGYEINVYEQEGIAGGVLAYGIPGYRLPKEVLQHDIRLIEQEGVQIHYNTSVGKDISFNDLRNTNDAIFVGIGTQLPLTVGVDGENLEGIIHGINFLRDVNLGNDQFLGSRVAVIGGGNTAIDAARSALRLGAREVIILYRRTRDSMPALDIEINEAIEEGIEIHELTQPVSFVGRNNRVFEIRCVKMRLGEFDSGGRRKVVPVPDSEFSIPIDTVIPAVSQYADLPFISATDIGWTPWGTFKVDPETMMTTMEGVFAGGDIVNGPDTVIQAIADGKLAAVSIDKFLGGRGVLNKGPVIEIDRAFDEDEVVELNRYPLDTLDLIKRKNSFEEVVKGYHKLTAMAESMRCLHCERR